MSSAPAVMVAVLAQEMMYTRAVAALLQLRLPRGEIRFETGASSIAEKRTLLAEEFERRPEFSHLLFLDSDEVPPRQTIERLLSHNLPIVSAAIFSRVPPYFITAWRELPNGDKESLDHLGGPEPVQRVDWCGTGCLLISREALLAIPRPWFQHPQDRPGTFEDTHFCAQAHKAGIPIHVDTGLVVGHLTVTSIDLDYVAVWQDTQQARHMLATTPGFDGTTEPLAPGLSDAALAHAQG